MNRLSVASLALVLVAVVGSTGCSYHRRYRVRYGYAGVRMYAAMYVPQAAPAEPPPPAEVAPQPAIAAGPHQVVVHANAPGTTVIVVNPGPGGVGVVQGAPPQQAAPMPRPAPPAQENPEGWFDGE